MLRRSWYNYVRNLIIRMLWNNRFNQKLGRCTKELLRHDIANIARRRFVGRLFIAILRKVHLRRFYWSGEEF